MHVADFPASPRLCMPQRAALLEKLESKPVLLHAPPPAEAATADCTCVPLAAVCRACATGRAHASSAANNEAAALREALAETMTQTGAAGKACGSGRGEGGTSLHDRVTA